ncbi:MAG: hypothetical protein ACR2M7_03990 [Bdellovibrionales bacterium]
MDNRKKDSNFIKLVRSLLNLWDGWLFRKEGTVSEPWPTAKELWNNPKVQKIIQNHNNSVRNKKKNTLD